VARYFGSKGLIYVAAGSAPVPPAGKISDVRDISFPQTPVKADRSSNDQVRSAAGVARYEGDLSFKCSAIDRANTGQAVLFAAINIDSPGTGTGEVFVEYHPEGTASGRPFEKFTAIVDVKPAGMFDQYAQMDVTLTPISAITKGNQP
jgi:hypothetical protein